MTEKTGCNWAKEMLYDEMAKQAIAKEAEIEVKRKKKAEEKIRKQQQRDSKPVESRFDNARRLRREKAEILAQEKKDSKQAKREERRMENKKPKKQEKCCNRVHTPRVAA